MKHTFNIRGEDRVVCVGQPVVRQTCFDMPRTEFWVVEAIMVKEKTMALRHLVRDDSGYGFNLNHIDETLHDTISFSGFSPTSETMEIPIERLGEQDLDGFGEFELWSIDYEDIEHEETVIKELNKFLGFSS